MGRRWVFLLQIAIEPSTYFRRIFVIIFILLLCFTAVVDDFTRIE